MTQRRRRTREATADEPGSARLLRTPPLLGGRERAPRAEGAGAPGSAGRSAGRVRESAPPRHCARRKCVTAPAGSASPRRPAARARVGAPGPPLSASVLEPRASGGEAEVRRRSVNDGGGVRLFLNRLLTGVEGAWAALPTRRRCGGGSGPPQWTLPLRKCPRDPVAWTSGHVPKAAVC